MTTKQQQHVSRFLEASLLRQAEGKLKKTFVKKHTEGIPSFNNSVC